jgi:hypothetical protein
MWRGMCIFESDFQEQSEGHTLTWQKRGILQNQWQSPLKRLINPFEGIMKTRAVEHSAGYLPTFQ